MLKGLQSPCDFCETELSLSNTDILSLLVDGASDELREMFVALINDDDSPLLTMFVEAHQDHHEPCTFYRMIDRFFRQSIEDGHPLTGWRKAYATGYRKLHVCDDVDIDDTPTSAAHLEMLWKHNFEELVTSLHTDELLTTTSFTDVALDFVNMHNFFVMINLLRQSAENTPGPKEVRIIAELDRESEDDLMTLQYSTFTIFSDFQEKTFVRVIASFSGECARILDEEYIRMFRMALGPNVENEEFSEITEFTLYEQELFLLLTTKTADELYELENQK